MRRRGSGRHGAGHANGHRPSGSRVSEEFTNTTATKDATDCEAVTQTRTEGAGQQQPHRQQSKKFRDQQLDSVQPLPQANQDRSGQQNSIESSHKQESSSALQKETLCLAPEGLAIQTSELNLSEDVLNKVKTQLYQIQTQNEQETSSGYFQRARHLLYPGSHVFRNTGLVIRSCVTPRVRNNFYPYRPTGLTEPGHVTRNNGLEERTQPYRAITGVGLVRHKKEGSIYGQQGPVLERDEVNQNKNTFSNEHINNPVIAADQPDLSTVGQWNQADSAQNNLHLSPHSAWRLPSDTQARASTAGHNIGQNIPLETKESELSDMAAALKIVSPSVKPSTSRVFVTNQNLKDALNSTVPPGFLRSESMRSQNDKNTRQFGVPAVAGAQCGKREVAKMGATGGRVRGIKHLDFEKESNDMKVKEDCTPRFQHTFPSLANLRDTSIDDSIENEEIKGANTETISDVYNKSYDIPRPDADTFFVLLPNSVGFRPIQETPRSSNDSTASESQNKVLRPSPLRPIIGASSEITKAQSEFSRELPKHPEGFYNKTANTGDSYIPVNFDRTIQEISKNRNCSHCRRLFRWPHLLTCYHTFCYPCIVSRYDKIRSILRCPSCCIITRLPKGLDGLNLNMQLCKEMNDDKISPFLCTRCEEECIANKYCKLCEKFLCKECLSLHQMATNHLAEPITKVAFSASGDLLHSCEYHAQVPVEMYCRSCSILVCKLCISGKHATHDVCSYESVSDKAKKRVMQINMVYSSMQTGYRKQIQNLNNLKQQMEEGDKKLRNEIHRTCNSLIETIKGTEKLSRLLVNKAHDEIIEKIQCMMDEFIIYREVFDHFQELIPRYIHLDNVDEFIICFPHITKTMDSLNKFLSTSPLAKPKFNIDIKFQPDYREFSEIVHECFKCIRFQHSLKLDLPDSPPQVQERFAEADMSPPYGLNDAERATDDTTMRISQAAGASVDESVEAYPIDTYPNFTRITTPYSRAFGKYGHGDYEFTEPSGVFYLHDGNLAVCDAKNHRIVVFDSEGSFIRSIGESENLPEISEQNYSHTTRVKGRLYYPYRAVQCPRSYNIIIVERPPSLTLQVFSFSGEFISSFGHSKLSYPRGLAVDECGFIFIVESRTMKFFIFDQSGDEIVQKYLANHLQFPNDIVARRGKIYISDNRSHCVHIFDYNLNCMGSIGNESLTYFPIGVALSHSNFVIVTDNHNTFNITVFDMRGQLVCGFKSRSKHANCYNVAMHPFRHELAVTTKECRVLIFHFNPWPEMPE